MARAYYNEIDPQKAAWVRELIKAGVVTDGEVDCRPIQEIEASELKAFTRAHFFCGIATWDYALNLAGWPDDRPVWTGSCPCPSFSAAGKGGGFNDPRHLWPDWARLIRECKPATIFGEQVDDAIGYGWLDLVQTDLERENYAVGKAVLGACSVGAPHIRQRLYFVADTEFRTSERHGYNVAGATGKTESRTQKRKRLRINSRDGVAISSMEHSSREQMGLSGCARKSGGPGSGLADAEERGIGAFNRESTKDERREIAVGGCGFSSGLADSPTGRNESDRDLQRSWEYGQQSSHGRSNLTAGFWSECSWLPCIDGKSRPVESKFIALSSGASGCMGSVRNSNAQEEEEQKINVPRTQADSAPILPSLRQNDDTQTIRPSVGGPTCFHETEILRPEMHGRSIRRTNESDEREKQSQTIREDCEGELRGLRESWAASRASQGQQSLEQFPSEFTNFVRLLPPSLALAELHGDAATSQALSSLLETSSKNRLMQHAFNEAQEIWEFLTEEDQRRIWLGFNAGQFIRTVEYPLVHGSPNRIGRLCGYGDAIVPQVAAQFVKAYLET